MKRDDRKTTEVQTPSVHEIEKFSDNCILLLGYIGEKTAYRALTEHYNELRLRYSDTFLSEGRCQLEQDETSAAVLNSIVRDMFPVEDSSNISHDKNGSMTNEQAVRGQYIRRCDRGIFGALWELGCELDSGMEIRLEDIGIRQITIELSNYFDFNPYMADSTGCYIVTGQMSKLLYEKAVMQGVKASAIGYITSGKDRIVQSGEIRRYLTPEEMT